MRECEHKETGRREIQGEGGGKRQKGREKGRIETVKEEKERERTDRGGDMGLMRWDLRDCGGGEKRQLLSDT